MQTQLYTVQPQVRLEFFLTWLVGKLGLGCSLTENKEFSHHLMCLRHTFSVTIPLTPTWTPLVLKNTHHSRYFLIWLRYWETATLRHQDDGIQRQWDTETMGHRDNGTPAQWEFVVLPFRNCFQLDCSPAPICQLAKQISNSTWGCNVYYWVCKFLIFFLSLGPYNHREQISHF